ncbi:translation initiation factor IF-2 [Baekduia soli]|uniref:Translation initiation factor IF-2 n=1 Tax=Baekduia soli TaxID=496014 RepID=A0A5B8U752_9ACTN|nr:translation initiation factor IF-2 [Baekduia soli]QEC48926.1 translation initiation factor IF-2 [Baekduia soli]
MAKKRIHEIAKEQGLSSKDVLDQLQAAGLDVKAAASTVEESDALRALGGGNGSSAPPTTTKAAPAAGAASSAPPAGRGQPARPPQGRGAPVRPPEGRGAPVRPPAGRGQPVRPGQAPAGRGGPVRPPSQSSGSRGSAPTGRGAPVRPGQAPARGGSTGGRQPSSPQPVRPVPRRPVLDDLPVDPRRQMGRGGPGQARPTGRAGASAPPQEPVATEPPVVEAVTPPPAPPAEAPAAAAPAAPAAAPEAPEVAQPPAPEQPAPAVPEAAAPAAPEAEAAPAAEVPEAEAAAPAAEVPAAEAPAAAATPAAAAATPAEAKKPTGKNAKPDGPVPHTEPPKPGTGPRIISVPEPPKRPKRDETQSQPSGTGGRVTRSGQRGEGGPGAGKRRVVIDSQAARRGPGGGPGPAPQRPPRRRRRRRRTPMEDTPQILAADQLTRTDTIRINSGSTVKDVAEYLGVPVPDVIKQLMSMGVLATLTKTLADEQIEIVAEALGKKMTIVHLGDEAEEEFEYDDADEDLVERPPVVTIMGHVDHGKTSLLDAVRSTEVAAGEAGGITQHIGAYQVHHNGKTITFLDTPGHQAFTAMRARGARVTDIAVIVVAADDGARPQTDEAIDHAHAADVPIVVAVNKIDKEGADPTRVRTELTQRGLQPSEWGGETEYVDVSAKTHQNLEELLDTLLVVAELEELEANPNAEASGVVIESKLDPGRGPVVTVLIQRGTMRIGDALVAGAEPGRVRAMIDYRGERVQQAVPGDPVEVLGFDGVPDAGEVVRVVANDREARRLAQERETREKAESLARRAGRKVSFEDVFRRSREDEPAELDLVIKGDVAGSVEALEDEVARLPQDEVHVNVLHSGVGGINESDVMLAAASEAVILGFNVRPVGDAQALADREGVEIRHYSVIYAALDDLRAAMQGLLAPELVEETVGTVEVRQTFRASKIGIIAGSYVTDGVVRRGAKVRVIRDGTVLGETTVDTLRRFNDDAREVAAGYECGIVLANFQDIREGDVLEVFETRQVERELQPS